jgi:recombinational DNA repair protein RecT
MKFLENAEEMLISIEERLGLAWWIEIVTDNPYCTYYFGPFSSEKQAQLSYKGYIEDLKQEEAQILTINIKRCQPKELTIYS